MNYFPAASSTTFEIDPALTTWSKPIDPGEQCLDAFQIVVSPDQLTAYLACTGILNSANATTVQPYNAAGYTGVIGTASASALPPIATTLSNPSSLAVLKNGLLAIGDYSPQSEVAFYNPADGGISYVTVNCPLLPDGGLSPQQAVTGGHRGSLIRVIARDLASRTAVTGLFRGRAPAGGLDGAEPD